MNLLPGDLTLRFKNIFSQSEMAEINVAFVQSSRQVTFRVNSLISSDQEIETELQNHKIGCVKIDFLEHAYMLDEGITVDTLWKLDMYKQGKIYIQGISSQIPVNCFSFEMSSLNSLSIPQDTSLNSLLPGEMQQKLRLLDACAAPGGKTSQLAEKFPDAEIWAFEPHKIRFEKMQYNLEKLGIDTLDSSLNSLTSSQDTSLNSLLPGEKKSQIICIHDSVENIGKYVQPPIQLSPKGRKSELQHLEYFDMILIDAPCSGEGGILYTDTKFLEDWDMKHIKKNYARQKAICDAVLPFLKTGGEMIYSTCTIAPEENEAVVHYLLCKYPNLALQNIDFQENKYIKYKKALKYFGKNIFRKEIPELTVRVIPSEFSEGFYIAKLRKNEKMI